MADANPLGKCKKRIPKKKGIPNPTKVEKVQVIDEFAKTLFDEKKAAYGRIKFDEQDIPVPYIRIRWRQEEKQYQWKNALRAQLWDLERPRLVVSITGGAQEFFMGDEKDRLLNELMESTCSTGGWIITAGSNVGIMKYVGEARCRYGGNIPLLAIVSFGVIKGLSHDLLGTDETAVGIEESLQGLRRPIKYKPNEDRNEKRTATLDANHSHIILIDDETEGEFGSGEIDFRAHFIAHARLPKGHTDDNLVADQLRALNLQTDNNALPTATNLLKSQIPSICICFEGGPNSIRTVAEAVRTHTPVLLIKGSGRAANLMADLVSAFTLSNRNPEGHDEEVVGLIKKSVKDAVFQPQFATKLRAAVRFLDAMKVIQMTPDPASDLKEACEVGKRLLDLYNVSMDKMDILWSLYCVAEANRLVSVYSIDALPALKEKREKLFDAVFVAFRKTLPREALRRIFFNQIRRNHDRKKKLADSGNVQKKKEEDKAEDEVKQKVGTEERLAEQDLLSDSDDSLPDREPSENNDVKNESLPSENGVDGSQRREDAVKRKINFIMQQIDFNVKKQEFQLMIEWKRQELISAWLHRMQESNVHVVAIKNLLNPAFHASLIYNRSEIAATLLSYGADFSLYSESYSPVALADEQSSVFKDLDLGESKSKFTELVTNCFQRLNKDYLTHLEKKKKIGSLEDFVEGKIKDDKRAKERLDTMLKKLLEPYGQFDFASLRTGQHLFLIMLITDRPGLAELFWQREAGENSAIILELTLIACRLCRSLAAENPVHRISNSLQRSADYYENFVRIVLSKFAANNFEFALKWVVNTYCPAKFCKDLCIIDLIVKGECEAVIEECHKLCIDAVEIRFSGNDRLCCLLSDIVDTVISSVAGDRARQWKKAMTKYLAIEIPVELSNHPVNATPSRGRFNFPIDDNFIFDVIAHGFHTLLLTALLVVRTESTAFALEIVVLLFFIFDELPDILLLGVESSGQEQDSFEQIVSKGLEEYFASPFSGEFFEFWGMISFLAGFTVRYSEWSTISYACIINLCICVGATKMIGERLRSVTFWIRCAAMPPLIISILATLLHALHSGFKHILIKDHTNANVAYTLYGLSVGIMWLRIMGFFLVQRELGQFVRVMVSMGRDLGFFGSAWGVLIFAFATMMLGAEMGSEPLAECSNATVSEPRQNEGNPVQQWKSWFLLRTFLQSTGSDQFDEMTTPEKVVIFLFMYPIFNILMVNLLVAIMSERYESAKTKCIVSYCFQLYDMGESYKFKVHTNAMSLFWNIACYLPTLKHLSWPVVLLSDFKKFVQGRKTKPITFESYEVLEEAVRKQFSSRNPTPSETKKSQIEFTKMMKKVAERAGEYRRVKDIFMNVVREAVPEMPGSPDALKLHAALGKKLDAMKKEIKALEHVAAATYWRVNDSLLGDDHSSVVTAEEYVSSLNSESEWTKVVSRMHFAAVLRVTVHGASKLKGRILGTRDSYLKLKLHDGEIKTEVRYKTQNPSWDKEFAMLVQKPTSDKMHVDVLQDEWIGPLVDCRIGQCDFPLRDIMVDSMRQKKLTAALGEEDAGLGTLEISFDYEELEGYERLKDPCTPPTDVATVLQSRFGKPIKVKKEVSEYIGLVQMRIVRAKNLNLLEEKVPGIFVQLELEKWKVETSPQRERDPEWNEYVELPVVSKAHELRACIVLRSSAGKNKVLARTSVPVKQITDAMRELELQRLGEAAGPECVLELDVRLVDFVVSA